jgi:hypothetical protein
VTGIRRALVAASWTGSMVQVRRVFSGTVTSY